jgi:hypothetical protein
MSYSSDIAKRWVNGAVTGANKGIPESTGFVYI